MNCPDAQTVFISCSKLRALDIIESLERDLGKPVITINQASLWGMLRLIGDRREIVGGGRLFREF